MKKILTSFTPLNNTGGVNKWCRDFISLFPETSHYSYFDISCLNNSAIPNEWDAADILGLCLNKLLPTDAVIIGDGFWCDKLGQLGHKCISVAHGIWSHLTHVDVLNGKTPEFPLHNIKQVTHRRNHLQRGGKIVAVSKFIADEMMAQWGFESTVINNAVDIIKFTPGIKRADKKHPLIIHGVTTSNKGFDHIDALKCSFPDADIMLLDDASKKFCIDKYDALKMADIVVHPSAYEGNSMFILEALASNIPVIGYNVGLLYSFGIGMCEAGLVLDRRIRSPETTVQGVKIILDNKFEFNPRVVAERYSLEKFREAWRNFLAI